MPYGSKRSAFRRAYRKSRKSAARSKGNYKKAAWGWTKGMRSIQRPGAAIPWSKTLYNNIHVDSKLGSLRAFQPPSLCTTHRYSQDFLVLNQSVTGLTGTPVAWRLGSLFDPDFSGTGHQPRGYDQLAQLYNQYQVYKVHIQVKVVAANGSGSYTPFLAVGVTPNANPGGFTLMSQTAAEIEERTINTVINCGQVAQANITFDQDLYLADIEGLSRAEYMTDLTYKAIIGNNPTKTPYVALACGSYELAPGCSVRGLINIEYYVKWTSPAMTAPS